MRYVRYGVFIGATLLLFLLFGLGFRHSSPSSDLVVVATEGAYPPFTFVKKDGTLTGFEVELVRNICIHQALRCSFVTQPFDALIPGLLAKKSQAVFGGISITKARAQEVMFSDIYYQPSIGLLMEEQVRFQTLSTLDVGTQRGTLFESATRRRYPKAPLHLYTTFDEAFLDLQSGRIQAIMGDVPILEELAARTKDKYVVRPLDVKPADGMGFAVAFRKDAEGRALRTRFDKGLASLKAEGTYDKLRKKWSV